MKHRGTTTSPVVRRAKVLAAAAAVAVAAAAVAGCRCDRTPAEPQASGSQVPTVPPAPPAPGALRDTLVPGTLWVTPLQPWRAPWEPWHILVDGTTALLSGYGGRIARFDLARGQVVRERVLSELAVQDIVKLPGGGWLAVGLKDRHAVAAVIDPATLEPKVVVQGIDGKTSVDGLAFHAGHKNGAVVLDDGVVIAGWGLPLAIYDPVTWQARRVVDSRISWSHPKGAGKTLYAYGSYGLQRFDLATGGSAKVSNESSYFATATHVVTRDLENDRWVVFIDAGGKRTRIDAGSYHVALDVAGGRLAVRDRATIRLYALDGRLIGTHELGDSGYGVQYAMAFDGARLVVSVSAVVRVIDLVTGSITPAGEPPYGYGTQLAVDANGVIQQLGAHAVRVANGKVTAERFDAGELLVGEPLLIGGPDEVVLRGAVGKVDTVLELFAAGKPGPVGSWRLPGTIHRSWLGGSADVVIDTLGGREPPALYRGSGDRLEKLLQIHSDASVIDVDVDGGIALIGRQATAHLVRLRDGARLHAMPYANCTTPATAMLERGGERIYLRDGADLMVYQWTTGALVAAVHIEGTYTVSFVHGHDELLMSGEKVLHLWNTATGELRTQPVAWTVSNAQVSPDARRVALELANGQIALVDLGVLRAAMKPGRAVGANVVPACESADPLEPEVWKPEDHDAPAGVAPDSAPPEGLGPDGGTGP